MKYKVAIITPVLKNDYLTDTIIDGFMAFKSEEDVEVYIPEGYPTRVKDFNATLPAVAFLDFASQADLIIFCWGKGNTNFDLAKKINRFEKTIFVDGSEVGGNRRFDPQIQKKLLDGTYEENGKVDKEMLEKCALYFKREKPYPDGVIPFPFGIERKYSEYYSKETKKEHDFFCVFGQDEYPLLRREVTQVVREYCEKEGFKAVTQKLDKENFYQELAKSKVGISVGGGGYDTARFWEILGNNAYLLTEKIDIYDEHSPKLAYERIWQFNNLAEFKVLLEKMGHFLREEYDKQNLNEEYAKILSEHSTKARVLEILEKAKERGII